MTPRNEARVSSWPRGFKAAVEPLRESASRAAVCAVAVFEVVIAVEAVIAAEVDIVIEGVIAVEVDVEVEGIVTVEAVIALLVYPCSATPSSTSPNAGLALKQRRN